MQLFYNSAIDKNTAQFAFNKTESRHIVKVLRKKIGDQLFITDGKGNLFTATVRLADDKNCIVEILGVEEQAKPWNYYIHVAISPTKNNDRFEWFLEKATEIGIDEITPIVSQRSERKVIKQERLEKIIETAAKQSLKFQLPKLNPLSSFSEFVKQDREGKCCIAHCEASKKHSLKTFLGVGESITILIGPEGDFTLSEINEAEENNYTAITLGDSRLRTETAGLVATQLVSFINQ